MLRHSPRYPWCHVTKIVKAWLRHMGPNLPMSPGFCTLALSQFQLHAAYKVLHVAVSWSSPNPLSVSLETSNLQGMFACKYSVFLFSSFSFFAFETQTNQPINQNPKPKTPTPQGGLLGCMGLISIPRISKYLKVLHGKIIIQNAT